MHYHLTKKKNTLSKFESFLLLLRLPDLTQLTQPITDWLVSELTQPDPFISESEKFESSSTHRVKRMDELRKKLVH